MKRRIINLKAPNTKDNSKFSGLYIHSLLCGIVSSLFITLPVVAAERIYFNYGPLSFSVSVNALETFAKEGKIEKELAFYLDRLTPEQQTKFRDFLNSRYHPTPITLYRFFNSAIGERLLSYMGELVQIQGDRNGFYAIRGAIVQAAVTPDGLTPINVIRQFPTNIELNTERILEFVEHISTIKEETKLLVAKLEQMTIDKAMTDSARDWQQQADLRKVGQFSILKRTIEIKDPHRQREFGVDLYLPEGAQQSQIPVIIMSHGFGVPRQKGLTSIAKHLASYGFAVAIPDNPGSDRQQQLEFLTGLSKEAFNANTFIDRPLDITYLLNELERLNPIEFQSQLNLQQVGVIGHSAGGYAALALAGAQIDFEHLQQDCDTKKDLVNLSLLMQCRALEIPQKAYNFQDSRIKAVFNFVPFGSSIFGQNGVKQIKIPTFLIAFSNDIFTPLILEQMPTFEWLNTSNKYLGIISGIQHVNWNLNAMKKVESLNTESLDKLISPYPDLVKDYVKGFTVAFFKVYLANETAYNQYLEASYAKTMSNESYPLSFIKSSGSGSRNAGVQDRGKMTITNDQCTSAKHCVPTND